MTRVLTWNGRDLPAEMEELPAGRYLVQPLDESVELTPEEEEGLRRAMCSLAEGKGISSDDVRNRLAPILKQ